MKPGDQFLLPVEFRHTSYHDEEPINYVRLTCDFGSVAIPVDGSVTLIHADRIAQLEAEVVQLQDQVDKFEGLYDAECHDGGKLAEALMRIRDARTLAEARRVAQEALDEDARGH